MKFSMRKRLLFLTAALLAVSSGASSMTDAEVTNFFGGASASDLQAKLKSDSATAAQMQRGIADTQSTSQAAHSLVGSTPGFWRGFLRFFGFGNSAHPVVKAAEHASIDRKVKGLGLVDGCLQSFQVRAKASSDTFIKPLASDIDRIRTTRAINVTDSDFDTAKDVNEQMARPYEGLVKCLDGVDKDVHEVENKEPFSYGEDPVVQAQIGVARKITGAEKGYEENLRRIQEAKRAYDRAQAALRADKELKKCRDKGCTYRCSWISAKSDISAKASDATQWVTRGWNVLGDKVAPKLETARALDWEAARDYVVPKWETVRDYGLGEKMCGAVESDSIGGLCNVGEDNMSVTPYRDFALQSGKVVGGVALAALGLYAAFHLTKLGYKGARALYNALWGNRSKKVRAAVALALGAAVAVAPSAAMQYGYLQ